MTAQIATFDLDSGRLEIANAGHPLPLHLRAGRPPETLACSPARPAGLGSKPTLLVTHIDRGDRVLFLTDGIVEARSPEGEFFGEGRLAAVIEALSEEGLPPAEVLRRCLHTVVAHQRDRPADDALLLLLRWADEARSATESDS